MPVTPEREVLDWWDVLRTGFNYFGDLTPYGFTGDHAHEWQAQRIAAKEIWQRVGSVFLMFWRRSTPPKLRGHGANMGPPPGWAGALPAYMQPEARQALKASLRLRATA